MLNVLLTGDKRAFRGMTLCILSILKHTKCPICFHIITIGVDWDDCEALPIEDFTKIQEEVLKKRPDCLMKYYDVSQSFINHFENSPNKHPTYSPASMARLLLNEAIKDVDKLIYLDCDTMAVSSLEEFTKINIDDYEMAVSLDYMGHRWVKKDYFNSGVLYINMKMINETKLFEKSIEILKHKRFYFADQSALYKCSTKRLYIPWCFNEQRKIKADTVIKHFNKGIRKFPFYVYNVKQWQVKKVHDFLHIFEFDDIYEEYTKAFGEYAPLEY